MHLNPLIYKEIGLEIKNVLQLCSFDPMTVVNILLNSLFASLYPNDCSVVLVSVNVTSFAPNQFEVDWFYCSYA